MTESLITQVLEWPYVVYLELSAGVVLAPAAGIGAPIFVLGLPTAQQSLQDIVLWYLATGVAVTAANHLMRSSKK